MWLALGVAAIAATIMNLYSFSKGKDSSLWMGLGLSFTALTMCAEYHMMAVWAIGGDWAAIEDVAPTMNYALWVLVAISVILNLLPVILGKVSRKKKA